MNTEIKLSSKLLDMLEQNKITKFTEIQEKAIPEILNQKAVLGIAQTGTGKTLAFALPIIHHLLLKEKPNNHAKALIIAPTRDLAIQIYETFILYTKKTNIKTKLFIGGRNVNRDVMISKNDKIDIIIGNPGRLLDLSVKRKVLNLNMVDTVVLDEADQMLDMGFLPDVNKIYQQGIKQQVNQSLMFSATMPKEILKLAEKFLGKDYSKIQIYSKKNVFESIIQKAYLVAPRDRLNALIAIAHKYENDQAIIFTRTRNEAKNIEKIFHQLKISSTAIHSEKSQGQRVRIVEQFKSNRIKFLIATDVMARGIDVKNLPMIINYNLPDSNDTYIHRIGRTARAGAKGLAITLFSKNEQIKINQIERMTKFPIDIYDPEKYDFKITTDFHMYSRSDDGDRKTKSRNQNFDRNERRKFSPKKNRIKKDFSENLRNYSKRNSEDSNSRGYSKRNSESSNSRGYSKRNSESSNSRGYSKRNSEGSNSREYSKRNFEGSNSRGYSKRNSEGSNSKNENNFRKTKSFDNKENNFSKNKFSKSKKTINK